MEISKSEDLGVQLTKATTVTSFVSDWRDVGTVTLRDTNAETGVKHELEIHFPLAVLRELSESLVKHIVEFDEAKAKKEAEKKAEESVE